MNRIHRHSRLASLPFCAALLLLAACGGRTPTQVVEGTPSVLLAAEAPGARMDRADILGAELAGDLLRIQVQHAGGCASHDFALLHTGVFVETLPVQTYLQLAHDAHGDVCRALITRTLTFDLSPLKQAYLNAYGGPGTIVIHLRAPGGGDSRAEPVRYVF
jgi:hypothetical protein